MGINEDDAFVASFTDAWIETPCQFRCSGLYYVASFTDAWIETSCVNCNAPTEWSHLLQMRGLKPLRTLWKDYMDFMSHLLQMRGLKPVPFKKPVFE
mgnify:CR=1 FL=1